MNETSEQKLLGDKVEELAKKLLLDKAAEKYQQITKKPCKCQQRKQSLNELHSRLRKRLSKNPYAK